MRYFVGYLWDILWNIYEIFYGIFMRYFVEYLWDILWDIYEIFCGIFMRYLVDQSYLPSCKMHVV